MLEAEALKAYGLRRACRQVFQIIPEECSHCKVKDFELTSGKEFMIKEIEAY